MGHGPSWHPYRRRQQCRTFGLRVSPEVRLRKKVRFEIAVNDNFLERTRKAIIKGARTGNIGDGVIFVLELAECYRIRTGEEGSPAIG